MKLLKMQEDVINSKKRVVVLTAQAGSGRTTALIVKLLDEAANNPRNMGVFLRRTQSQIKWHVEGMLNKFPKSRYSKVSGILTAPYKGKTVKIKFLSVDDLNVDEFIPLIAIDQAGQFNNIPDIIKASGRVIISDYISEIEEEDSWAYESGLLTNPSGEKPIWDNCVDHVVGYAHNNPNLRPEYLEALYNCNSKDVEHLMRVKFK
ncbi:hypothetical protein [Burkholderia pseudomallei]|jgi:hypothetical protein|uniref:hypothetical protein n=1 Tax=Burkholderia pseudomallei TaxID=28450 RepID=UPI0024E00739|nr:hypothetical protein [Burkholderia pseudomallei]